MAIQDYQDDIGSHYKKDGIWYERVFGPGPDVPLIVFGPGPNPDPRPFGPLPRRDLSGLVFGPTSSPNYFNDWPGHPESVESFKKALEKLRTPDISDKVVHQKEF